MAIKAGYQVTSNESPDALDNPLGGIPKLDQEAGQGKASLPKRNFL